MAFHTNYVWLILPLAGDGWADADVPNRSDLKAVIVSQRRSSVDTDFTVIPYTVDTHCFPGAKRLCRLLAELLSSSQAGRWGILDVDP